MKINTKILARFGAIASVLWLISSGSNVYATHTISLTTSGPQSINVRGDTDSATISSDNINVSTTCRSGYNFVISTSVSDNNLYLDGDASNNAAGTYFTPSDGTSQLLSTSGTWGYYYNETLAPTTASVFAPVPALGSSAVIKTPLVTPSTTDINDTFSIYYGISGASTLLSGIYKMTPDANDDDNNGAIIYQATVADSCIRYTVEFNPTDTSSGSAVTGTGTMANQTIYEGIATNLNTNTFTAPSGYNFVGWNTAQDGSGTYYTEGASVTDLTTAESTITLYAMWSHCTNGTICYHAGGTNVSGTMADQTEVANNSSVVLFPSNYSRPNYGFAGWSDQEDYATNASAHFYGPMANITAPTDIAERGFSLYAVWVASAGSLQDSSTVATLCGTGDGSLTTAPNDGTADLSSVSALTDQRDGQTYAIAKLSDGKCWMIENLRLDNTATTGDNQTNPSTTNASLAQGYGTDFIGLATSEAPWTLDSTDANSLYTTDSDVAGKTTISGNDQNRRFPRYNNYNTASRADNSSGADMNTYSYGNYYTWAAAIADIAEHNSYNDNSVGTSLCPAGWHLPKGGNKSNQTDNEFWNLIVNSLNDGVLPANYDTESIPYYDDNSEGVDVSKLVRSYPNNFLYSGGVNDEAIYVRGSRGDYWSTTPYSANLAYNLSFSSSRVRPGTDYNYKSYGFSVRCVAE